MFGRRSGWDGGGRESNAVVVQVLSTFCHPHLCIWKRECGWSHSDVVVFEIILGLAGLCVWETKRVGRGGAGE